jgi:entericidin B
MKLKRFTTVALVIAALTAAGCANTIKGVGKDAANTVNATEQAAGNVANAVE